MILIENIKDTKLEGNELKNYRRKKKILNLLYQQKVLSATVLGKRIGVSLPTAILMLNELSDRNLVDFRGTGESKGGRKPKLFGLKQDSIFVIACELGRFEGKIGIYNPDNKLVAPISLFDATINDDDLVDKIYNQANALIEAHNIDEERIFGIGLAMPGLVDSQKGINYTIKNSEYQNIEERLQEKFHRLVYINNDARMQAYGEFIQGEAHGHKDALIVNWHWGLGLGMILNGRLYNGSTGFAGELSHTKFVDDGDLCICGKKGCLETVVSITVLNNKARAAVHSNKTSQLTREFKGREQEIVVEDIINAAKRGDEFSIELLHEAGQALGKSLANTIQLLNPNVIVLGGIVSEAKQFILNPIQQAINVFCLEKISGNTKVVLSKDWKQAGLYGVTATLFQKLFSSMQ